MAKIPQIKITKRGLFLIVLLAVVVGFIVSTVPVSEKIASVTGKDAGMISLWGHRFFTYGLSIMALLLALFAMASPLFAGLFALVGIALFIRALGKL